MNQHKFFYAHESADDYDRLVGLTSESYHLAHRIYRRTFARLIDGIDVSTGANIAILDLGCGTGHGVTKILSAFPTLGYVGFDISREMLGICEAKVRSHFPANPNNIQFVSGDARNSHDLLSAASNLEPDQWVVISAFMFHHMSAEEKAATYRTINEIVGQNGLFINLDLFDFCDPIISEIAFAEECHWIQSSFEDEIKRTGDDQLEAEKKQWLFHVTHENRPIPIFGEGLNSDKVLEETLLTQAGFKSVASPFRHFQTGLVVARS